MATTQVINELLEKIEDIKTDIQDNQYKILMDTLKVLHNELREKDKNNIFILSRYHNLKTDYIGLTKRFITLYDEFRGEEERENIDISWRQFIDSIDTSYNQ
jgi:hypothetical protein